MSVPIRLVCFCIILLVDYQAQKTPSQIGKKTTPFSKGVATSFLISVAALWGFAVFWLVNFGIAIGGNAVVLAPFLLSLITLFFSGELFYLTRKRLAKDMQGALLVLPIVVNLALSWQLDLADSSLQGHNWLMYGVGLLFFFVCSLFYFGIKERLKLAPIPDFLQGLPIQLMVLFLIFLSLSFFQGVFFGELF